MVKNRKCLNRLYGSDGQGETAEMAETAEMTALLAIIVLSMLRIIAHGSFTLS